MFGRLMHRGSSITDVLPIGPTKVFAEWSVRALIDGILGSTHDRGLVKAAL